jgi:hypothetical protein
VIHCVYNNATFSIETVRNLIDVNNDHQFLHDVHAGDVFS